MITYEILASCFTIIKDHTPLKLIGSTRATETHTSCGDNLTGRWGGQWCCVVKRMYYVWSCDEVLLFTWIWILTYNRHLHTCESSQFSAQRKKGKKASAAQGYGIFFRGWSVDSFSLVWLGRRIDYNITAAKCVSQLNGAAARAENKRFHRYKVKESCQDESVWTKGQFHFNLREATLWMK